MSCTAPLEGRTIKTPVFFNTTFNVMGYRRKRAGVRRRRLVRRRLGVTASKYGLARAAAGVAGIMLARRNTTRAGVATGRKVVIGLKRRPGRPRVRSAGGGQLSFRKHKFGRPPRMTVNRVVRLLSNPFIFRWQGINKLNSVAAPGCPGKQILHCFNDTTTGNGQVPIHLFNLTQWGQQQAAIDPSGYALQFTDQGTAVFVGMPGQNNSGADQLNMPWQFEATDIDARNKCKYVKLDWLSINLMLHGCTTQPTYYDVMMVTFTRDIYDPLESVTQSLDLTYRSAFWQTLTRNLVTNPIMMGNAESRVSGMRVLRRYRVLINPSSNTDLDTNPESRVLKIFYRDGRTRDYDYGGTPLSADQYLFGVGWRAEPTATSNFQENPRPSRRIWLMIRASNTTSVNPASVTRADTPSYDICMRRKCTVTNNGHA